MDVEPPDRRTVVRRRRHRPPVITGDDIEYPPAPYTFEARVGTLGFLARQLRRRGMPDQARWAVVFISACFVGLALLLLATLIRDGRAHPPHRPPLAPTPAHDGRGVR